MGRSPRGEVPSSIDPPQVPHTMTSLLSDERQADHLPDDDDSSNNSPLLPSPAGQLTRRAFLAESGTTGIAGLLASAPMAASRRSRSTMGGSRSRLARARCMCGINASAHLPMRLALPRSPTPRRSILSALRKYSHVQANARRTGLISKALFDIPMLLAFWSLCPSCNVITPVLLMWAYTNNVMLL